MSFGQRYHIDEILGQGGMGTVYKAFDRLNRQTVALKVVRLTNTPWGDSPDPDTDMRVNLAQEFKTLASLRHPNIISVLDYGFDLESHPYFTMDYLPGKQSLNQAAEALSLDGKIGLLIQVLQALAYLHRRRIIHRDVKPSNVMVVDGQVKVLDFGLAAAHEQIQNESNPVGTLSYMAPELLKGHPASESSDLYAVGVMAYEIFAGRLPFTFENLVDYYLAIQEQDPPLELLPIPRELQGVIGHLLTKHPSNRPFTAVSLIKVLNQFTSTPIQIEDSLIRESYLQGARFVGRTIEFETLTTALSQATHGQGSAWLLGGESGVGKTRLIEEVRIQALVEGALVIRGQSVSEGGTPYAIWQTPLRQLCLEQPISEFEAGVLKTILPDLETLLDWETIPDPPAATPQETQDRLLEVVLSLFQRAAEIRPVVLLLEDLQWDDNWGLLHHLSRNLAPIRGFILGSYRDDEQPDLPTKLPEMQRLRLERLPDEAIAELSASMLGEDTGRLPQIVDLLQRETEGNVFFVVEVLRTLAEEAGELARIGSLTLPAHVFAQGIRAVVERRLSHVPESHQAPLRLAAVLGRQLDLTVMAALMPDVAWGEWLNISSEYALIEVQDDHWRFAHDKLREGVLAQLSPNERSALHEQAAQGIEKVYGDAQAGLLAYHWDEAGQEARAAEYWVMAGTAALQAGAYESAVKSVSRAAEIADKMGADSQERVRLAGLLSEAYYGAGDLTRSLEQIQAAIGWLDAPFPAPKTPAYTRFMLRQTIQQILHRIFPLRFLRRSSDNQDAQLSLVRLKIQAVIGYFLIGDVPRFAMNSLSALNQIERMPPSVELPQCYAAMAPVLGFVGQHRLANLYAKQAVRTLRDLPETPPLSRANVLHFASLYWLSAGQWAETERASSEALGLFEEIGVPRSVLEALGILGMVALFQGQFAGGYTMWGKIRDVAQHTRTLQGRIWALTGLGILDLRLGNLDQAQALLLERKEIIEKEVLNDRDIYVSTQHLALLSWRMDKPILAAEYLKIALEQLEAPSTPGVIDFYTYVHTLETCFHLWQATEEDTIWATHAERYTLFMVKMSAIFPAWRPRASLFEGKLQQMRGENPQAAWEKSLRQANQLKMPYDAALTHAAFAAYLPKNNAARPEHYQQAAKLFQQLNATWDLAQLKTLAPEQ